MQKRILVVDDDTMNLVRTKMILEKDYEVLLADSGIKALDKIKGEPVDLVLLDIEMPKLNGIETFERMKEFAPNMPVIFLTASGLEEDVRTAIRLGAVNYLMKPFQPQELMKRISQEGGGADSQAPAAGGHHHCVQRDFVSDRPDDVMGAVDDPADDCGMLQYLAPAYRAAWLGHPL